MTHFVSGAELARQAKWFGPDVEWGSRRASASAFSLEGMTGGLMRMPGGQRAPWHGSGGWPEMGRPFPDASRNSVYVVVSGEVDFMAGDQVYRAAAGDFLPINAVVYAYANPGLEDVLFWCLMCKQDTGPLAPGTPVWDGDPQATSMLGSHPYYDAEPTHLPFDPERIGLVRWDEYRRDDVTWCGGEGTAWGAHAVHGRGVCVRAVRIPAGNTAELPPAPVDRILLGFGQEAVTVRVADEVGVLGKADAMLIPANEPSRCENAGENGVAFLEAYSSVRAEGAAG